VGYATEQNIVERYGQDQLLVLADRDGDGIADQDVIARALADADAEIDAYLAGRYELPLAAVPVILTRVACDLVIWHLCDSDTLATDQRRKRYEDAVGLLKRLASGEVSLGQTPEPPASAGSAVVSCETPRFGRERFRP
jgi:phage gp36-like protein